jgi:hypothetical protein
MMMAGVVLLSASLFYLNATPSVGGVERRQQARRNTDCVVYDDVELPQINPEPEDSATPEASAANQLLNFTRTAHTSAKQLPLLGMPDKAFYHIH